MDGDERRAHWTLVTFATQTNVLARSGAARLLGYASLREAIEFIMLFM